MVACLPPEGGRSFLKKLSAPEVPLTAAPAPGSTEQAGLALARSSDSIASP
jgi:hypothetical protein